jgi:hypothetical protein
MLYKFPGGDSHHLRKTCDKFQGKKRYMAVSGHNPKDQIWDIGRKSLTII